MNPGKQKEREFQGMQKRAVAATKQRLEDSFTASNKQARQQNKEKMKRQQRERQEAQREKEKRRRQGNEDLSESSESGSSGDDDIDITESKEKECKNDYYKHPGFIVVVPQAHQGVNAGVDAALQFSAADPIKYYELDSYKSVEEFEEFVNSLKGNKEKEKEKEKEKAKEENSRVIKLDEFYEQFCNNKETWDPDKKHVIFIQPCGEILNVYHEIACARSFLLPSELQGHYSEVNPRADNQLAVWRDSHGGLIRFGTNTEVPVENMKSLFGKMRELLSYKKDTKNGESAITQFTVFFQHFQPNIYHPQCVQNGFKVKIGVARPVQHA